MFIANIHLVQSVHETWSRAWSQFQWASFPACRSEIRHPASFISNRLRDARTHCTVSYSSTVILFHHFLSVVCCHHSVVGVRDSGGGDGGGPSGGVDPDLPRLPSAPQPGPTLLWVEPIHPHRQQTLILCYYKLCTVYPTHAPSLHIDK